MIKICEYCGNEFRARENKRRFCSVECSNNGMRKFNPKRFCKYCGKEFIAKRKGVFYCSRICRDKGIRVSKYDNSYKKCKWCKKEFKIFSKYELEHKKFCCPSHAGLWRAKYNHKSFENNYPETKKLEQSRRLKEQWKNNEFRNNVINRMKTNNPVYNPEIINQMQLSKQKNNTIGFTGDYSINRGGNGKLSPTEDLIYNFMISLGFKYNTAICTAELRKKEPDKKFAYSYKPDFVHPSKLLCIEIDGKSHETSNQSKLDLKKEYALNFYGYRTYRYTNEYINNNITAFKNSIINLLGYKSAKVVDISNTNKPLYMYDIEIQDNHNYFANQLLVHNCKSIQSGQAVGIMELDKSASKVGMTGTLLVNNPYDLFCPMSFVGLINYNKWVFERKYVMKDDWGQIIGYQNMEDLHNILYKSSIRRTKDLLDLPAKVYKQEWLEFNKDEQDTFDQIIGVKPFNLDLIQEPFEPITAITRMRQCTVASELLTRKRITSTKFERLKDICDEAKANNQKVLVFCPFTQALELGMEYCKEYNPRIIKGGMGDKIKETLDAHENQEGFSLLLAQEATLGVGYTLVNTSIVVFLSPPWSRATYDQCVDRCFAKNTIVMTLNGPKYIQDITTQDYVFTPYGNIKKVTATHIISDNQRPMVNIRINGLDSKFEIKCTADHKILNSSGEWQEAGKLKVGDYVFQIPEIDNDCNNEKILDLSTYIENSNKLKNYHSDIINPNESYLLNSNLSITKELMFLIGMYLGNGFVEPQYRFFSIGRNNAIKKETISRIQKYLDTIANYNSYLCNREGQGEELRIHLEPLARFLEFNFGRKDEEKFIPQWIFDLKKEYLESLLEGLINSDNYIQYEDNNTIKGQYTTTTPSIASSVWFLLSRLGYKPEFYTVYHYRKGSKQEYKIEYNCNTKTNKADKIGRITSITPCQTKNSQDMKLYDISVEDDECYMVGNLPVHNCHRIGQKKTVQVIDLLIKDTYDELIYKKLHGKGAMADVLVDGAEIDSLQQFFTEMNLTFKAKNIVNGEKEQEDFFKSISNIN